MVPCPLSPMDPVELLDRDETALLRDDTGALPVREREDRMEDDIEDDPPLAEVDADAEEDEDDTDEEELLVELDVPLETLPLPPEDPPGVDIEAVCTPRNWLPRIPVSAGAVMAAKFRAAVTPVSRIVL